MRGWSSIFVGLLLFGAAAWSYSADGFGSATLICAVAGSFFLVLGAQGLTVGEAGNPIALVDFVRDPAGAIVDTATDRIGDWFNDDKPESAAQADQAKFDPDAVIERYLAQRTAAPEASTDGVTGFASQAPARTFGRKGV
jgi:hypothetical protein